MEDAKNGKIIEIICPNKLKLTPTGIQMNAYDLSNNNAQYNRFICPLCSEEHDWNVHDVVVF
ncbi:hypothetical protein [uncultured Shewanella sp.]|uniref:hypothetical protein n=1 Tax=uncultured Shewanella sp. TaxID=173975 RepID=UPI002621219C|nr:hypothetical protein [uncultured Shewanella sp.]